MRMEKRVLVIYTGGTIGMVQDNEGALVPMPKMMTRRIRQCLQLHDSSACRMGSDSSLLVMPSQLGEARVFYWIHELAPLLDSSNMCIDDWIGIAELINVNYDKYDGFVVLHGTDTLAYTASALSFMLENLSKTVVVTGSQVPIFEPNSDGLKNFRSSVLIAGNHVIPEVTIYFDDKLFRGNRSVKAFTVNKVGAFDSPNAEPLAFFTENFIVNSQQIFLPIPTEKFVLHDKLNPNVAILKVFPTITKAMVESFLAPPIEGVILETYGAGNIPDKRKDIVDALSAASARGVIIVNCTQCFKGSVLSIYATNKALVDGGVISGHDLTSEAALTKLSYVLSKTNWDRATKCTVMERSIRGELSNSNKVDLNDNAVLAGC